MKNPIVALQEVLKLSNTEIICITGLSQASLFNLKQGVTRKIPEGFKRLVITAGRDPEQLEIEYQEFRQYLKGQALKQLNKTTNPLPATTVRG